LITFDFNRKFMKTDEQGGKTLVIAEKQTIKES